LSSRVSLIDEGDFKAATVGSRGSINREGSTNSNGNVGDNSIGESLKSSSKVAGNVTFSAGDVDGSGFPLSSEQVRVSNGDLTSDSSGTSTIKEADLLDLIERFGEGQDVVTTGALAKRAVSSLVVRVADTSLDLLGIPESVIECVGSGSELTVADLELAAVTRGRELLDVVASTVARAVVGAGGSSASLTGVSLEALALTGSTVADTLVGALSVGVSSGRRSGGINPGLTEAAHSLGAVRSLPVSVASAAVLRATGAVTRAKVGAGGSSDAERGSDSDGR